MAIPPFTFRRVEDYKGLTPEELDEVLAPRPPERRASGFDELDAVMWLGVLSLWL